MNRPVLITTNRPISGFSAFVITTVLLTLFIPQPVWAAESIGQLSDPNELSIPEYCDIIFAEVEKTSQTLTFSIKTRGTIPESMPDPCNITFLWLIDADNNPETGQNPWEQVGSEFNVRAVVGSSVDGYVDVTGAWPPGGGQGSVTIDGNQIQITIEMEQIGSPDLFHFRCDAFTWNGSMTQNHNGVTSESAETWVSNYAVVYDVYDRYYGIDQNSIVLRCDSNDPFNPDKAGIADHEMWNNEGNPLPQFNSIQLTLPVEDSNNHEYFNQSLGSADFLNLRNLTYFDVVDADTGTFGQSECKTTTGVVFSLLSKSEDTGLIPQGLFKLNIRHDYHLRASSGAFEAWADTYAQIVITDITDLENIEQKLLWPDARAAFMDQFSSQQIECIDLADYGLEFENIYRIDLALIDKSQLYLPTDNGQAAADSSLIVSIDTLLTGDLDKNRLVNFSDFARFVQNWLEEK